MERAREKLQIIIPVTLCLVFLLIYLNTRSMAKVFIVMLAMPFPSSAPSGSSIS